MATGYAEGREVEAVLQDAKLNTSDPNIVGLLYALQRLDSLLERAVTVARATYGPEAGADRFRGLHISQREVERLLAREPGAPTLRPGEAVTEEPLPEALIVDSRLAWLAQAFGLSPVDVDLILIALAPELDLRHERRSGAWNDSPREH